MILALKTWNLYDYIFWLFVKITVTVFFLLFLLFYYYYFLLFIRGENPGKIEMKGKIVCFPLSDIWTHTPTATCTKDE